MKTLLCLTGCFCGVLPAFAQSLIHNGACSARFTDLFSFVSNTASLAICPRVTAGVYAENRFGLKDLNKYIAAAQFPLGKGAIGLITDYAGAALFNQSQIGLAYGKQLGAVNLGLRFNYNRMRVAGYGSEGTLSFELGSIWKITEKFFTGLQVNNLSLWRAAAGYECSEQLLISASITKEENKVVDIHASVQYTIAGKLLAMLGINSSIASPSLCLGWLWKNMRVVMSGSFHPQLGLSKGIAIIFYGKKKEE